MRKLEKLVHDAVDESDREILNQTEELGYFSLSLSQFRGKLGWVTWVIMIVQTLLFLHKCKPTACSATSSAWN